MPNINRDKKISGKKYTNRHQRRIVSKQFMKYLLQTCSAIDVSDTFHKHLFNNEAEHDQQKLVGAVSTNNLDEKVAKSLEEANYFETTSGHLLQSEDEVYAKENEESDSDLDLDFVYSYSEDEESNFEEVATEVSKNNRSSEDNKNEKIVDHDNDLISASYLSEVLINTLAPWSIECNIPHNALSKLLHKLKFELPQLTIPVDPRTLLKTPRHTDITEVAGGFYCHFGFKSVIHKIINKRLVNGIKSRCIKLQINVDGAPFLGNSSEKNMWPILAAEDNDVYIVGVYAGQSKPTDANAFLEPFVNEAADIIENGVVVSDERFFVDIDAVICDAPAKCFVLGTAFHTGYYCCTKCDVKGEWHVTVTFPGNIGEPRTDEKFEDFSYEGTYQEHKCILTRIPRFGCISKVPIDSMHCLCLGCMRKLLLLWLQSKKSLQRLPLWEQDRMNEIFLQLKEYVPYEFARKPRDLKNVKRFKATEFRQFLLYTGIIVLKKVVSRSVYINFVTLHVASTILYNPELVKREELLVYADTLLETFVEQFTKLYGKRYVSYNIHHLRHLVECVRKYGPLESFSAFRFENYLGWMKKLIRKGDQPLQQLMRRCAEIENFQIEKPVVKDEICLSNPYNRSSAGKHAEAEKFSIAQFKNFKINCEDKRNNCVLINNQHVVNALHFTKNAGGKRLVIGNELQIVGDLYDLPCKSSILNINVVRECNKDMKSWNIEEITSKLCKFPYEDKFVTIPIIHTICSTNSQ